MSSSDSSPAGQAETGRIKGRFVETGLKFTSFLKTSGPGKLLMGLATTPEQNARDHACQNDLRNGHVVDYASLGESGDGYGFQQIQSHSPGLFTAPSLGLDGASFSGTGDLGTLLWAGKPVPPKHRQNKLYKLLEAPVIDIDALREVCWNGIPLELRPLCWRLLLGYLPPSKARQERTVARKRREYYEMILEYYEVPEEERSEEEAAALRQVIVDVPRTAPSVPFFQEAPIQQSLERLLYIWGIRHPASGYVQGMNDLVTPFLAIFLSEHMEGGTDMEQWRIEDLTEEMMLDVEADSYWCLCKLIEGIQDHYTFAQPGIQRSVFRIKELVRRVDKSMAHHFDAEGIDFIQFAWRWVNCLLIREVPFRLSYRLWDTYLAEGSRFCDFLVYVSASFLLTWGDQLRKMEFQEMIMFLQKPPSQDWDEAKMEMMLSRAFIWRTSFGNAQSHLKA